MSTVTNNSFSINQLADVLKAATKKSDLCTPFGLDPHKNIELMDIFERCERCLREEASAHREKATFIIQRIAYLFECYLTTNVQKTALEALAGLVPGAFCDKKSYLSRLENEERAVSESISDEQIRTECLSYLKKAEKELRLPAPQRLSELLADCLTQEDKAARLQMILSSLLYEYRDCKPLEWHYESDDDYVQKHQLFIQEHTLAVYHLSDRYFFDMSFPFENLNDDNQWALCLILESYNRQIFLQKKHKPFDESVFQKPYKESLHDILKERIHDLLKFTVESQSILEKVNIILAEKKFPEKLTTQIRATLETNFLCEIQNYFRAEKDFNTYIEGQRLKSGYNKIEHPLSKDQVSRIIPFNHFHQFLAGQEENKRVRFIQFMLTEWKKWRGKQVEFFQEAYQALESLIQAQRKKLPFLRYKRDIFTEKVFELNDMPQLFPNYKEFLAEQIKIKRAQEVPLLPPATPSLPKSRHPKTEKTHRRSKIPSPPSARSPATAAASVASPPRLIFHRRVTRWLELPIGQPLSEHDFPEYVGKDPEHQRWMHISHGFSTSIDDYLSYGVRMAHPEKEGDTVYVIPATLQQVRGMITYCFSREGVCYHRYFSERQRDELISQMTKQTFFEYDFPSLSQAQASGKVIAAPSSKLNETITIDSIFKTVTILSKYDTFEVEIKLFQT